MSVTATAKLRRRQAANGNRHVAKLGRRVYRVKSVEKARQKLADQIMRERLIAIRKGLSKKK